MTAHSEVKLFIADLSQLSDLEIQQQYLNCWEWTESIAVALSQLEDEIQILGIIKLAFEVDLVLGAKLISGIPEEIQEKAIAVIFALELPKTLEISLLITTQSKYVIPHLKAILDRLISSSSPDFYCKYKISKIIFFFKDIEPKFTAVCTSV